MPLSSTGGELTAVGSARPPASRARRLSTYEAARGGVGGRGETPPAGTERKYPGAFDADAAAGFADADEFSLATPRAGRGAAFFLAWRSSILPPAFAMAGGGGAVAAGALSRTGARTDCLCGLPWP